MLTNYHGKGRDKKCLIEIKKTEILLNCAANGEITAGFPYPSTFLLKL